MASVAMLREKDSSRMVWLAVAVCVLLLSSVLPAQADGFIIPVPLPHVVEVVPDLVVRYHRVEVRIEDQVAQTHIDQVFFNDSPYELEGTYIFPLPDGAAISDFAMFVDGTRLSGKILDKDEARRIYESIVQRRRDPAILEYVGRNAFQASIYPIPAHAEKRVEIAYSQVVMADKGLIHYVYPLSTERFSSRPLEEVVITVDLRTDLPIKAIYSPSHKIAVERTGERSAVISFEATDVRPDKDFELYYSLSEDDVGLSMLSFKESREDGFFLLFIAPKVEADRQAVVAKDVVFVLDTSGSMDGEKLQQAQEAVQFVLDRLHPEDRFNIVAFATGIQAYASSLRPASERDQAGRFVRDLSAGGGTDIHRALLEALDMSSGGRPQFILFLTDGLPTVGVTELDDIVDDVDDSAGENVRLFSLGVGYDVNTLLLDTISQEHRGASAYVVPGQNIEEEVASFYDKVSTPLLSDLHLQLDGIATYDLYPYPLPDLFAGSQLLIVGRYKQGGSARVTLQGEVNGEQRIFRFPEARLSDIGGQDFIPLLWATRKVGHLLKEIRLHGENAELVEEIVALSVRYGIMTPYTSFLVDESQDILTAAGRDGLAASSELAVPTAMPFSGAKAVADSQTQNSLVASEQGGGMVSAEIKTVANKTFVLREGFWTDTSYDPQKMPVARLDFGGSAYFGLLSSNPECGKYLAVGERLILVLDGEAYQIEPGMVTTTPAPSGLLRVWERIERWWYTIRH